LTEYRWILRIGCQRTLKICTRPGAVARVDFIFAGGEQRFAPQGR
jgi:hypothetical protein